ncbi:MAG: hybrid sensor histidine kinase/response regulator [Rhodospirillales bacterium]|nr:hybrid sensor histidine kinase/response regulator [Rhodospirillales bacterium]
MNETRLFEWMRAASRRRYSIAIAAALLATAIRFALDPLVGHAAPYVVQISALVIIGLLCGLRPALLAVALSALLALFLFVPPRFSFAVHDLKDVIGVVLFALAASLVVYVAATGRHLLKRLHESETRLTAALDASNMGTWRWRAGDAQLDLDERLRRVVGWPLDHPAGIAEMEALVMPTDFEQVRQTVRRVRDGEFFDIEFRVRPANGGMRWLAVRGMARRNNRRLVEITGTARDITSRKQNEAELSASEQRFRALIETMPLQAWMCDANGECDYLNQAFCEFTGLPPEMQMGQRWIDVLHPADRYTTLGKWKDAVAARQPYEVTVRMRRHDGAYHWFRSRGQPIYDTRGEIARWIGVDADIDDIVRAREALTRSNDELETLVASRTQALAEAEARLFQAQKMEALGQLTGGVAHDFNNLLSVVLGNAELLEKAAAGNASYERRLESIRMAAQRGTSLTRQLLAFARRQELHPETICLAERLRGLDDMLSRSLRSDVELSWTLPPALWRVAVDPTQFDLALLNLAVNARDAMEKGGSFAIGASNVTLRPGEHPSGLAGDFVRLTLRDSGVGMSEDVAARAFDPFFTTKDVGKGSGLGLSQVYGFAHQSGGTVRLASEAGRGTEIELLLPRSDAPTLTDAVIERPVPHLHGGTVLLIDDDDEVARTTAELLEQCGFRVEQARDAASARTRLGATQIDLVVTDVVMPGGTSGLDLARELRRARPGLPVLLMTGFAGSFVTEGFPVLAKPFTVAQLQAELDAVLGQQSASLAAEIAISTDA